MEKESVCVVTVTYGNREGLLKKVLKGVEQDNIVKEIIVVNNGSNITDPQIYKNKKVEIINLTENTGSAYGYSIGLAKALTMKSKYILTIDDDNLISEGGISNLVTYQKMLKEIKGHNKIATLALRKDRLDYYSVANGVKMEHAFTLKNGFLGWHVKDIPKKIKKKLFKSSSIQKISMVEYAKVPVAPYGGLLLSKELLEEISLPNEGFYLYCDDYEFTYRINKIKGETFLIPGSTITDIDETWFIKEKGGFLSSFINSDSKFRVYYGVRNRVYFEVSNLVEDKLIYYTNRGILLSLLFITALIHRKIPRFLMIVRAMKKGEKGSLGKTSTF